MLNGDYWSGIAQDHYEYNVVEEARDIVAGTSQAAPTVEHLRVLLEWLDGCEMRQALASEDVPF